MTKPTSFQKPPEAAKQFLLRVVGFTLGVFLAISSVQLLVFLGVFIISITTVLAGNKQQKVKLIPGLLIVFLFCLVMIIFCLAMGARSHRDDPLFLLLRPWYVSVMIGIWGVGMVQEYRKWRTTHSEK